MVICVIADVLNFEIIDCNGFAKVLTGTVLNFGKVHIRSITTFFSLNTSYLLLDFLNVLLKVIPFVESYSTQHISYNARNDPQ